MPCTVRLRLPVLNRVFFLFQASSASSNGKYIELIKGFKIVARDKSNQPQLMFR